MQIIGVISEYNPFHNGHAYHIQQIRHSFGEESGVLCVMSGNWVQRGDAAILDKWTRASIALQGGADLVIELPTLWAVSSAETFARAGISLLESTGLSPTLSFGSESGDLASLSEIAVFLSSKEYRSSLHEFLKLGLSFPLARQRAASCHLGKKAEALQYPNNNLGVEYLRAIYEQTSSIVPSTVRRKGASHDSSCITGGFASASLLRRKLLSGEIKGLSQYVSQDTLSNLSTSPLHSLSYCTRGVLARLRAMTPADFLRLPDCKEGLHHRLFRAAQTSRSLDELYHTTKSRRYTHSRIRRLVLWAFLGIKEADRPACPPYLRVLGMNLRGQQMLKKMKQTATIPILTKAAHGKKMSSRNAALFHLEAQCTSLYELCSATLSDVTYSEYGSTPIILKA